MNLATTAAGVVRIAVGASRQQQSSLADTSLGRCCSMCGDTGTAELIQNLR
jgi:hypothetical protein